jgi:hypothetical protein
VLGDGDWIRYPRTSKSRLSRAQSQKQTGHYKAEQGDAFSLLFNHGMPPIRLLREIVFKDETK